MRYELADDFNMATLSTAGAAPVARFQLLNEEDLAALLDQADSKNTKRQIKYAVSIFEEYCSTSGDEIEKLTDAELDDLLSRFYGGARNKSGELYSKKTMQAIRYGLQRHFESTRKIDIVKGNDFKGSNKVFKAFLEKLKKNGKGKVKRHPPVSSPDMQCIQQSLDLNTAEGLQHKVFIDVMVYFANRGGENLREMEPDDYELHTEENGRRYYSVRDKLTKNHRDDDEQAQAGLMYEIPGHPRCPVTTMLKFKSKLNPSCKWMWQRPRSDVKEDDSVWYANMPIGKNQLGDFTKVIAEKAGCSRKYTNHCLRATSCTVLVHAGFASRHIMTVSGHKSESSIKYYSRTSEAQKEVMSDTISSALGVVPGNSGNESHQGRPTPSLPRPSPRPSPKAVTSLSPKPGPPVDAELSLSSETPMSDSQVENLFNEIAKSPGILQDVTNSPVMPVTVSSTTSASTNFHFHGCTVHIYNKSA